ncbi:MULTISPECIES: hypothetical protein [unclassified Yoonia]|nr:MULTISPECIES: hypothetical protein [unclassified Yoonia]
MKKTNHETRAVEGVTAQSVRPTVLGAALVAGAITFPIGVTIQLVSLLLL